MARFDVHPNPDGTGYLLNVQADLLAPLKTRVVVPLWPRGESPTPLDRLNPVLPVLGADTVMLTQLLAAVPVAVLGSSRANLEAHRDRIVGALDFLYQGF